jgi:signal transduction histidine kinase
MSRNLIFVDDNEDEHFLFDLNWRSLCQKVPWDYDLRKCFNGKEALDQLNQSPGSPWDVILDINMPVMNGLELLAELKPRTDFIDCRIFISTSSLNPEDKQACLSHPLVKQYLVKPYKISHLADLLTDGFENNDSRSEIRVRVSSNTEANLKLSFLLISSDPSILTTLPSYFERVGQGEWSVKCIDTLKQAIHEMTTFDFDGCILDHKLSDGNGLEWMASFNLLSENKKPAVIVLSGERNHDLVAEYMRKGARDFFVKAEMDFERLKDSLLASIGYRRSLRVSSLQFEELSEENADLYESQIMLRDLAQTVTRDLSRNLEGLALCIKDNTAERLNNDQHLRANGYLQKIRMLVGDLTNFIGDKKLDIQEMNLREAFDASIQELHSKITLSGANIQISGDASVLGSESRFRYAMLHILDNALKYGREGVNPIIKISVKSIRRSQDAMNLCQIRFEDNGSGLTELEARKIFEPGYRSPRHAHIEGKGMGLSTVRRILAFHSGSIQAQGVEGQGSVFTITLPGSFSKATQRYLRREFRLMCRDRNSIHCRIFDPENEFEAHVLDESTSGMRLHCRSHLKPDRGQAIYVGGPNRYEIRWSKESTDGFEIGILKC